MKNLVTLIIITLCFFSRSQTFSSPESVEFDQVNQRWLVGQNGSGKINIFEPSTGTLIPFAANIPSGPHGIEILGNTVYCCDGSIIKGFDLSTGIQSVNIAIAGSTFLNGLTTDGANYLFATDFSGKKIYRVHPASGNYNVMQSTVKTPNGIYYDGANDRCVYVTWGANAEIQAISLIDSTISTLKATSLGSMDGITRDIDGNWYFTTWSNNSLNRIDPTFTNSPVVVMSGLSSPADIDINLAGDSIGIPNSGTANNVVFYTIQNSSGLVNLEGKDPFKVYPVPSVGENITILLEEPVHQGRISLINGEGKVISESEVNGHIFILETTHLDKGSYFLSLVSSDKNVIYTNKIIIQ
jgi:hypothetical protein